MTVMGTRPEVIKLAPVIMELRRNPDLFELHVVTTSQHRQMLDQMLETFGIEVDLDLDIMRDDQNLDQVTRAALAGLYPAIADLLPHLVVVQGDTTTTLAGALAAFYHKVPVAHVEAGLRTFDKLQPFPEEINRRLTSQIADFHFAPTETSRRNLLSEAVPEKSIWVTGNTAIDSLFLTLDRLGEIPSAVSEGRRILVTAHRRENHGEPLVRICRALLRIADEFPDVRVIYPMHLSPRIRTTVLDLLGNHPRIELPGPMGYKNFVAAMNGAYLILTDSGGIQEEAPSLGKPVLVLRETTERPEGVAAGTLRLVGTGEEEIFSEARRLLVEPEAYRSMSAVKNPYGDGKAAGRILKVLRTALSP
jgi:UDP-N-acetylglucosamine 2-epimerase (non-hydrolysing)